MNKRITVYIGTDVHEESIEIAPADATAVGEVRHCGRIRVDLGSLDRAVRQLGEAGRSVPMTLGPPAMRSRWSKNRTCNSGLPGITVNAPIPDYVSVRNTPALTSRGSHAPLHRAKCRLQTRRSPGRTSL